MSENLRDMDERERAAYYQAHRDEDADWEEVESPVGKGKKVRLGATVTVRLPSDEMELVRKAAAGLGVTYSEIIRKALQAYCQPRFELTGGQGANTLFVCAATAGPRRPDTDQLLRHFNNAPSRTGMTAV